MINLVRYIIALSCLMGFVGVAWAETWVAPELVRVKTPIYTPNHEAVSLPSGTYVYDVSWQGIPAAEAKVSVDREGQNFRVVTSVRTSRGIDIFYRLRYRAEGLFSAQTFRPVRTVIDHHENSRITNTQISFEEAGMVHAIRTRKGKDTKIVNLPLDNFTLEPFAAAFLARSLDWAIGDSKTFDTFNGKVRYLITLSAVDKVKQQVNGIEKEMWVIEPRVKNLSYPDSKSKLHSARIYVTADSQRDIIKIVSSVFVGSVTTALESFTPAPKTGPIQYVKNEEKSLLN